jgi:ribosomal protein S18 acetylase RimI-like enzyme
VTVLIRTADHSLAPAVARVHLETALFAYRDIFPPEAPVPAYDDVLAQWQSWLGPASPATERTLVAVDGGAVIGVGRAGVDTTDNELGHLSRLYVEPSWWDSGIGGALYLAAIEHLRSAGFTVASLWVLERNTRARTWYERLGWRATGERKPVFAPAGIDDVRYVIDL